MNRTVFIILSALLVLVLLGVWVYLLFFASNTNEALEDQVFTNSEFENTDDSIPGESDPNTPADTNEDNAVVLGSRSPLRQLTTKNVAGFAEVKRTPTSTAEAWFMESGVGHIYSVDLFTGVESRISATTIPDARAAVLSSNGKFFAVKHGIDTGVGPVKIGYVDATSTSARLSPLEASVTEFTFLDAETLGYTVQSSGSLTARSYNFVTKVDKALFTTPFREATIIWGKGVAGPHYFYPKTAYQLEGFIYQVVGSKFNRLPFDGYGLSATADQTSVITGSRYQSDYTSSIYNLTTKELVTSSLDVIPKKCTALGSTWYCGSETAGSLDHKATDQWHQGTRSFKDNLWSLSTTTGQLELVIEVEETIGRTVDMSELKAGTESMYFKNKPDQTLWIFEPKLMNATTSVSL